MQLYQKIILQGTLECLTGLRVGAAKESVDIGGVDLPVVRRKDNDEPYIPGSSLKGKIRCLLEQAYGENFNNKFKNTRSAVCELFGALENKDESTKKEIAPSTPSRLIVRDAYLEKKSAEDLKALESTDMPYTEIKFENSIDRVKGTADHPRQIERIPAGASFSVEMVINIFAAPDASKDQITEIKTKHLDTLRLGVELLNRDYLGGHGSRGYGQVDLQLAYEESKDDEKKDKDSIKPKFEVWDVADEVSKAKKKIENSAQQASSKENPDSSANS